jgi:hypothetical protein
MGDMADYYREQEEFHGFGEHNFISVRVRAKSYTHWRQQDGSKILLSDMTKCHLQNCIRIIHFKDWRTDWREHLQSELDTRD